VFEVWIMLLDRYIDLESDRFYFDAQNPFKFNFEMLTLKNFKKGLHTHKTKWNVEKIKKVWQSISN